MKTPEEITENGFYWYDRCDQFNALNNSWGVVEVHNGCAFSPGISRGINLEDCEGMFFTAVAQPEETPETTEEGMLFVSGMVVGTVLGGLLFAGLQRIF